MLCDTGLQIFLLVYSSLLTAIMISFGIFLCCRKRSSKTVVDSGSSGVPSRRVVSSEMTHQRNIESGVDADQVSVNGNLYANIEDGRDVLYMQDERGKTPNNLNRMSPSTPLSNLSRSDGMFDMTELHLQDEVEENLYSSAKEETDSGNTNYEEVISITSKERNSFSLPLQDAKEDVDMLSTISTSSSSSKDSVKNQPAKPIVEEKVEDDKKLDARSDAIYSNVERKYSSSSSSASSTSTMQDNQNIQHDQQNFKHSPNANIQQSNSVDEEDPVALHFKIFNQESYKKRYNSQHDLSRKSSSSSNDEKELMAALGPNVEIDTNQTSQWANKVFNDVEKNLETPRRDSLSSSEEESLKEEEMEIQPRLPDVIQEPSVRSESSSSSSSDEEDGIIQHDDRLETVIQHDGQMEPAIHHDGMTEAGIQTKKTYDDTDSLSSEDNGVIKSMVKVENVDTQIQYQSSSSENDEDPNHPMESSSDDEENPQSSLSGHHFQEKGHPSMSEEESSSESADSQSMQQVDLKNTVIDDRDIYNRSPIEHPKVTELKISDKKIPAVSDSPVMVRQCTPVYHISSSSNSSSSDEDQEDDDEEEEEPIGQNLHPTQNNNNMRGSSSASSSDDEISPKPLKRHPIVDLRTLPSGEEQLQPKFPARQTVSLQQSSSLTSDEEEPRQVINLRKSSLSSSDRKSPEKSSSSSQSSSDEEKGPPLPQQNLRTPQVTHLRRNSSGSPSSIFKRLNYDYVSVYTKVELARKKLRDKNYNNVHDEMINDMETDI